MNNFGQFIKSAREAKKLTLTEVAENAGISHSHLSRIESGERNPPKAPVMQKLAHALGINFLELMEQAGQWGNLSLEEKEQLIEVYSNEEITLNNILSFLRIIRTDEGTFPGSWHNDLYKIFGGRINMLSDEQDRLDKWYPDYLSSEEENRTKAEEVEALEEFNTVYNYKNIKDALIQHDERYITGQKSLSEFLEELQELFLKRNIKTPHASSDTKGDNSIDIEDLVNNNLIFRGRVLSEEEKERYLKMTQALFG
ncbi:hypothetical protein J23TS9_06340 [Paenibacillus sp. J23TS9]|uniref:helix-turn-helix domain-containing protein n=1 Tax=Paenibacillus sp. J23TS9 TaxID=2807193 RepID=UPI001B217D10|nr:helix-turn-helix transcriptional regulator [Paenibacillus sp. J23TS9]GIP25504.1 hypothetical protein J23TS9_06340 [Paenibacillus sp. J23TS9]